MARLPRGCQFDQGGPGPGQGALQGLDVCSRLTAQGQGRRGGGRAGSRLGVASLGVSPWSALGAGLPRPKLDAVGSQAEPFALASAGGLFHGALARPG